jgi:4a-hydroxytetrahydrobiopterin dehydratase|tara:strand:- start:56 stop:406 length:351 start_codon:yes stop_codon:yes gene_type:complete
MSEPTTEALRQKKCLPCEGGVPVIESGQARLYIKTTPDWGLDDDAKWISRDIVCKNFLEVMEKVNQIAEIAESEGHHPDLHITGYRKLRIDLSTHAIGGLSENDFILAAKIDQILA